MSKLLHGIAWTLLYLVRHLEGRRGWFDGYLVLNTIKAAKKKKPLQSCSSTVTKVSIRISSILLPNTNIPITLSMSKRSNQYDNAWAKDFFFILISKLNASTE